MTRTSYSVVRVSLDSIVKLDTISNLKSLIDMPKVLEITGLYLSHFIAIEMR